MNARRDRLASREPRRRKGRRPTSSSGLPTAHGLAIGYGSSVSTSGPTDQISPSWFRGGMFPNWSPDGSRIAYEPCSSYSRAGWRPRTQTGRTPCEVRQRELWAVEPARPAGAGGRRSDRGERGPDVDLDAAFSRGRAGPGRRGRPHPSSDDAAILTLRVHRTVRRPRFTCGVLAVVAALARCDEGSVTRRPVTLEKGSSCTISGSNKDGPNEPS